MYNDVYTALMEAYRVSLLAGHRDLARGIGQNIEDLQMLQDEEFYKKWEADKDGQNKVL